VVNTQGADKSLARPGRKQARKHFTDARDFNNIETRAVIKLFFLQGKAKKEIHAILTETLACFLPDWAKDLLAPLYLIVPYQDIRAFVEEFLGKFSYESRRNKFLYKGRCNYSPEIDLAGEKKIRK